MDDLAISVACGTGYDYMQVFNVHDVHHVCGLTARRTNADGSYNLVTHADLGTSAAAASIIADLRLMYISGINLINGYRGYNLLDHIVMYLSSLGHNVTRYGTTFVVVTNE